MKDCSLTHLARFVICLSFLSWSAPVRGDELMAPPRVKPLDGAAVIEGQIEAHPECARGELEAWLSQGSLLLYQVDVVQHGTFEFHVLPGRYNLIITGSGGCFSETRIEVGANRVELLTVSPVPTVRPEKHGSLLDWLIPPAYAFYYPDCPSCNLSQMLPSFMPPPPWWAYFGGMAYANFATPGGTWGYAANGAVGSSSTVFPGKSGFGLGKPALYLEGKEGTPVTARIKLDGSANWLAAVPAHGESGWSGRLQGGHLVSGGAEYRELLYDFRADPGGLQDTAGFCANREGLVPQLKVSLRESGFKEGEIHDFETAWGAKIPLSSRYCVFPQTGEALEKIAHVEVAPKPKIFTRLSFVIQVEEGLTGKLGKFTHAPAQAWKPELALPETRMPAGDTEIRAREWSAGFLLTEPSKNTQ